jgi:DHA2 family multidrug resistance protein
VGLLAILLSPLVGKNVAKVDPRRFATVAFLGFAFVLWMRSHFTVQADFATIMVPTILQGGAIAFFFIPLSAITLNGLTPDRIPSASGLTNFVRITAGAMGTSAVTTLWDNRATLHHVHMVEKLTPTDPATAEAVNGLMGTGMSFEQAVAQIARLIDQQAFTRAADDVYLGSAMLFLCLIPLIWLSRPQRMGAAVDAGGAH